MPRTEAKDLVAGRGKRGSTPVATALFVGLRALDPLLQRSILIAAPLTGLAARWGLPVPSSMPAGGPVIQSTGLTPYQTVVWAFSIGSALKQIYWILGISNEPMSSGAAAGIAAFNTVSNSLNTLLFTLAASNPTVGGFTQEYIYIGGAVYVLGIFLETYSEIQRKSFKAKKENAGKPCVEGLWRLSRHINYFGYMLWRSSYALACGGPIWGSLIAAFFTWDFSSRAIPVLQRYLEDRYGEPYKRYESEVPYKFAPFLF